MQRLLEIPQEVYDFLRNFRLRAGDLNRDSPGCLLLPLRGNSPCGGSKTAPFTHPLPGVPAPLAGISILQQAVLLRCDPHMPLSGRLRYSPGVMPVCFLNSLEK